MDSDSHTTEKEINGINLDNYFPHQQTFNSVIYLHKKFLKKPDANTKVKSVKKTDKSLQFGGQTPNDVRPKSTVNERDPVMEQTIKFAKDIVPLVIPPDEVFYTIKTAKRHRAKKPNKHHYEDSTCCRNGHSKEFVETFKKVKKCKESYSTKESVSHSASNTLDDLNINPSLCCTYSDLSEKKVDKKQMDNKQESKFVLSQSFEALATETIAESKIKIHLMNDKDKHYLSESITIPVLDAIRDYIAEFNNNHLANDVTAMQKTIKSNTNKLDTILDRLANIEKKLDSCVSNKPSPKGTRAKPSKLEELEEDLIEGKDDLSSGEEVSQGMFKKVKHTAAKGVNKEGDVGGDLDIENANVIRPSSSIGTRKDWPNRIPARCCWTDAKTKNLS